MDLSWQINATGLPPSHQPVGSGNGWNNLRAELEKGAAAAGRGRHGADHSLAISAAIEGALIAARSANLGTDRNIHVALSGRGEDITIEIHYEETT